MLITSLHKPEFLSFSHHGFGNLPKLHTIPSSWTIAVNNSSGSFRTRKKEELSIEAPATSVSESETQRLPDLRFDRLQVPEKELIHETKFEFGQFVAREAVIDEEYWTSAWLRAESQWEDRMHDRYADSHKRKFAEQEFHAMRRRRTSLLGQKCRCIVTERVKPPLFCNIDGTGRNRYGYVANLCIAKSARRQGIATSMLLFAIELIKSNDIEYVYVHVHRNNSPAQKLYEKMGFEIVEAATSQLLEEQNYLLCCKI